MPPAAMQAILDKNVANAIDLAVREERRACALIAEKWYKTKNNAPMDLQQRRQRDCAAIAKAIRNQQGGIA